MKRKRRHQKNRGKDNQCDFGGGYGVTITFKCVNNPKRKTSWEG